MTKPVIVTKLANLAPRRIDNDLIRRVIALKEAGWADQVRIAGRAS